LFDLNIQRVLEHWTVSEALREVIANALDEQALSGTAETQIFQDSDGGWHVRDFGRGLRYEHFTQNEDAEKLAKPNLVIGKFGVGLKDALATFDRHDVGVVIRSRHCEITVESAAKHDFEDVLTLHAVVREATDPGMDGTEFELTGLTQNDVDKAKEFFLMYSGDAELEATRYGAVLRSEAEAARIYVNGLRVAEEPNFLFSYNITSLTKALRSALNRERSNVGRQAYSDRVKAILLACSSSDVADRLAADLASFASGTSHDETTWIDVSLHACKVLNAHEKVVFVTAAELYERADMLTHARGDGYREIVVPETVANKLPQLRDVEGNPLRDLGEYGAEWNRSFAYDFISADALTDREQIVFSLAEPLLALVRQEARRIGDLLISQTMRLNAYDGNEAVGVWDPEHGRVIIKRDQLQSPQSFLGTLLHEVAHAFSSAPDVNSKFEEALTHLLGQTGTAAVRPGKASDPN